MSNDGCTLFGSVYRKMVTWFWHRCEIVCHIHDNEEKKSAFIGICHVIKGNPQALVSHFLNFCEAVLKWNQQTLPVDLKQIFLEVKSC